MNLGDLQQCDVMKLLWEVVPRGENSFLFQKVIFKEYHKHHMIIINDKDM